MGLGIVEFHQPYQKNEFSYLKKNDADYYYVEDGFFKIQNSIGNVLFTILHLLCIPAFYVLIVNRHAELLFICELFFYLCVFFTNVTFITRGE